MFPGVAGSAQGSLLLSLHPSSWVTVATPVTSVIIHELMMPISILQLCGRLQNLTRSIYCFFHQEMELFSLLPVNLAALGLALENRMGESNAATVLKLELKRFGTHTSRLMPSGPLPLLTSEQGWASQLMKDPCQPC